MGSPGQLLINNHTQEFGFVNFFSGMTISPNQSQMDIQSESPTHSRALSEDVKKLVTAFYFQTNIVYTAPGLKDEMTHWADGKKTKLRKYYLEVTIPEALALFKEQHPNVHIGLSKFYTLKPPNVIYMSKSPNDQCKCIQHEAFRMLLSPFKIDVNSEFWTKFLCSSQDLYSKCWTGDCNECSMGQHLTGAISQNQEAYNMNDDDLTTWYEWTTVESTTKKDKVIKRTVKALRQGCVAELKAIVTETWNDYVKHVRTKRLMSKEFQNDMKSENVLLFQCDFAMDYNCKDNSREAQSAIYGRQNVVLFTAAIHHNDKWKSYAVVTSSDKYKSTVRVCMLKILKDFVSKNDISTVDKLIIWSDGPSSEFKNKFCTGKLLFELSNVVKKVSYWKYFATSHGKGVCDGIGGTLKARASEHARGKHRDNVVIQSYTEFFDIVKQYVPKITLFLLSKEEVEEITDKDKPWDDTIPIPGVSQLHLAKVGLDGTVEGWKLPKEGKLKSIQYQTDTTCNLGSDDTSAIIQTPGLPTVDEICADTDDGPEHSTEDGPEASTEDGQEGSTEDGPEASTEIVQETPKRTRGRAAKGSKNI